MQGRFAHMFKPGNEWMIEEVQKEVDKNWEELLKLCELEAVLPHSPYQYEGLAFGPTLLLFLA